MQNTASLCGSNFYWKATIIFIRQRTTARAGFPQTCDLRERDSCFHLFDIFSVSQYSSKTQTYQCWIISGNCSHYLYRTKYMKSPWLYVWLYIVFQKNQRSQLEYKCFLSFDEDICWCVVIVWIPDPSFVLEDLVAGIKPEERKNIMILIYSDLSSLLP